MYRGKLDMEDRGDSYMPKKMPYGEAMSRIVRQYSCSRKEAFSLLKEFESRNFIKVEELK